MLLNCGVGGDSCPLDSKEIKPVAPKGNQPQIFIRRPDAKAEAPILWPPDAKHWLIWKDPDVGKDWKRKEKGATEEEMVGWHHWLNGHEFEQAPGVCLYSSPSNQWCYPNISSYVAPFSSCLQSFPTSGSFQMSQFFSSGGQSIGVSASASVLPMNIQDWFPLGLTGLISLLSKELSSLQPNSSKSSVFLHSAFFIVQLSHPDMTTGKKKTKHSFD